jgi:hypothetical protein
LSSAHRCTSHRHRRAFSLLEVMIAGVILSVTSAAVVAVVTGAAREAGAARVRALAAADAHEVISRIHSVVDLANQHGLDDNELCVLLRSAGAPLDATAPAVSGGACPALTVSNVSVQGTTLMRGVVLEATLLGTVPGLRITVTMTTSELSAPVVIVSQVRRS